MTPLFLSVTVLLNWLHTYILLICVTYLQLHNFYILYISIVLNGVNYMIEDPKIKVVVLNLTLNIFIFNASLNFQFTLDLRDQNTLI